MRGADASGPGRRCYTRHVGGKTRDRGLWLTLAALTVLLVVLAVLQYRWVSEIGRAEAERRQVQLERSAARFAGALDRELGRALMSFARMEPPRPREGDPRPVLVERLAAWGRDEHAALVSGLLLATRPRPGEARLEACAAGERAFHEVPWPAELMSLRQRLVGEEAVRERFVVRPGKLVERPLGLLFPLVDPGGGGPPAPPWGRYRVVGVVVVQLDLDYLRGQLLPQLTESHFGPAAEGDFVVAVVRRADRAVVYSSDAGVAMGAPRPDDVQRSLPGRFGRPGLDRPDRGRSTGPDEAPAEGPRGREPRRPEDESPWLLVARHREGTLEQAVASVRRRNLAVGLGVLALLGTTAVILATGAQRARRLARQQMEFVAGVTHELNTPLAAIRSAGQNLADGIVTDPAQVRRYGGLIEKEGGRLTVLVAQILDFAGIESGARAYAAEPVSVARLVDEVLGDHRLALDQAGMTVERDVREGLPEVRGDAGALRRALANLVANAVKFAAAGGWIAVRAAALPGDRTVVVRVEDKGPGIPREERERVFEPFHRGPAAERNDTPGSGLGLSLVRHVVRAHGGRVFAEGRPGGGTAFVLELPAASGGGGA
ncbi:MAG TPA: HAMP domain-containing sensor histidine kinase [Vicinamibacteria bacterium]|nr:HAMP domain-containing sensor histidine kinase [Vicinamibacteria bacterium]